MDLKLLFGDKSLRAKEKSALAGKLLLAGRLDGSTLAEFAASAKDPVKAQCLEALEFATRENPSVANDTCFSFAVESLCHPLPRVRSEAARVVSNIAHLFPDDLDRATGQLLINASDKGTVVRWSAAMALAAIMKAGKKNMPDLIAALQEIADREEKNSIRKIYRLALKPGDDL